MKSHLIALLTFMVALVWTSSGYVVADTLDLQLDSENSAITISGTVEISGISVPLTEQEPNSLVAKFAGNIPVEVAGGYIRFPGGAAIRALEPNDWKPGVGGAAGTAKASYGAKATATIIIFTVNTFAASRNLVFDATSANLPLTSGQFPGGSIDFKFADTANTTLDFAASGALTAQGTKILSGLLTNQVASVASFSGPVGEETLTIPVHSSFGFEAASDTGTVFKFQLRFDGQLMAKRATVDDCVGIPGVVARWRAENSMLDSVGNHHGQLVNANLLSSYFTNGPTCRAVYFNGNGGGAYINPSPELEFKDGDDFTIESWIRVDTGAAAYTGNLVLLDHRSPPTDKYLTNPDGSFVYWPDGSRRIEGELSIGYLFSLFRQGNEQNGRWILECQINSRERYFAGLVNTNIHADINLSPTLEDPSLPQQRWNHVAVSIKRGDPAGGGFFVNGRRVGTFDTTPFEGDLTPTNAVPIRLGLHARDGYFRYQYQGAMDNMAIYRRALTDADIAKVYQSGVEGACCRNLGVSIANPPLVSVQSPFDARIRVARTGGRPPRSIVVTNEIPPGLTLLSAIPQIGTVTNIGQKVIWTVGDLDRTGDESVSLRLRLITAETNTFRITAVVGYSGGQDDEPNDDHAESVVQSSGAVLSSECLRIQCPSDLVRTACADGILVTYDACAQSLCGIDGVTVTCVPPSGSFLAAGTHTVVCTATDAVGNLATCSFKVTVQHDAIPPRIQCPGNLIVNATSSAGAVVNFSPIVTDDGLPVNCLRPNGIPCSEQGPFSVDAWPPTINQTVKVQYVTVGDTLAPPNDKWLPNLSILTGGDQLTDDIEIGGFPGKKVTGNYLNVADLNEGYTQWADQDTIDILMQVYGDAAVLNAATQPRNFHFLLGTLPELTAPVGGQIPVEAKNAKWNWVLFRVPNGTRPSDGSRYVGSIPANAQGAAVNAGVHGGTIRLEGVPNLIVRAIAWGPRGAFGEPEAVNMFAAPGICDPNINTNHPSDLDPAPVVVCTPPSGSVFPPGFTTVVCTATDRCGLKSECRFTVTVLSSECLQIQCPTDLVRTTCADGMTVNFDVTAQSRCGVDGVTVTCVPPSGSFFAEGTHTVVCTATDAVGNLATCFFKVTVQRDTSPPRIQCPGNQIVNATSSAGAVVNFAPVVGDDLDPDPVVVCTPPSGSVFPPGFTTVTCTATDRCGLQSECRFTVTVLSSECLQIQCPTNLVRTTCAEGIPVNFDVTAQSRCGVDGVTVTCIPPSGSFFAAGTHTVVCTATDAVGNLATCFFKVTVQRDTAPPRIQCPSNQIVTATRSAGAVVNFAPVVSDDLDPSPVVVCTPPSGSVFPPGFTTVTCTVTDRCGLQSECSFTITVLSSECLQIQCPTDLARTTCADGLPVNFEVTAQSRCGVDGVTVTCVPPSGSFFAAGTHTVVCTATDAVGNYVTCSFNVTVQRDTAPPRIQCPVNLILNATSSAGAVVNFAPVVSDDLDPAPVVVCTPPSGSVFPPGFTTVTCTVTDRCGHQSECRFTVTVLSSECLQIQCPTDLVLTTCADGMPVNFDVTAQSRCGVDGVTVTCVPPSGSFLTVGPHTVVCTATDAVGNQATCSFKVTVQRNTTPPRIQCPVNLTLNATSSAGAVVNFAPVVSDDLDPAPVVVCMPPSGSVFPAGITTVTCTVTDRCGLQTECRFTVTVLKDDSCITLLKKPKVKFTGTAGTEACFTLTLHLKNTTGVPVRYIYLIPTQACLSFAPPVIDLSQIAFGGSVLATNDTRVLIVPFKIAPGCPLPYSVLVSLHDAQFRRYCEQTINLPFTRDLEIQGFDSGTVFVRRSVLELRLETSPAHAALRYLVRANGDEFAEEIRRDTEVLFDYAAESPSALVIEADLNGEDSEFSAVWWAYPSSTVPPSAALTLSLQGGITLRFSTQPGQRYVIEATSNLGFVPWRIVTTWIGDGSPAVLPLGNALDTHQFYRVRLE